MVLSTIKRNASARLGSGPEDAAAIMAHPFFKGIVWDDVPLRKLDPPFKPILVRISSYGYFCNRESKLL